jgi:putative tricarboxylic transport membrane protein
MKFNDAVSGALLLVLAVAILVSVRSFPAIPGQNIGPGVFPATLAVLLALCAVLLIFKGWAASREDPWVVMGEWMKSAHHLRNFFITIGCLLFYIFASEPLGFLVCSTVILMAMFWALRVRGALIVPLAALITLVIHTVFYKGLRVPLPWGVLQSVQW